MQGVGCLLERETPIIQHVQIVGGAHRAGDAIEVSVLIGVQPDHFAERQRQAECEDGHGGGLPAGAILLAPVTWAKQPPAPTTAAPVDALIPWLLQEDAQLRALPFAEVILDATGKKVIATDPQNAVDHRVIKEISRVLDEVVRRVNAPGSVIEGISRINEASSHFEDLMRELLNAAPGRSCDFPRTADGRVQRSG